MKVVFGSRGSDLALTQTRMVIDRLTAVCPYLEIELRIIKTTGDNKPDARLEEIGGLGAFTREIEVALLDGEIDVAVHSLKDLPTRQPEGLVVAAVAGRVCPNDVLISQGGRTINELPAGSLVGTSSLRRRAQLLDLRPDIEVCELRGNVPTRMGRVASGELDAVILAAAGLTRLGLLGTKGMWEIPMTQMLPAPGQGALALEARVGDAHLHELLKPLHDADAATAVACERAALQAFGGGCRAPLGVYAQVRDGRVFVQAFAADIETGKTMRLLRDAPVDEAVRLGEAMGKALHQGTQKAMESCSQQLRNRRIVVTRAVHQAASFGGMLEEAGAWVLYLPLIEITPVLDAVVPEPGEKFDWVVFTSVNAVENFICVLQRHNRSIQDYASCNIAAIGDATAAALNEHGLQVVCTPEAHVSHALVDVLLQQEPEPEGKRVLLPQGNLARPIVAEALAARGMEVFPLTVYKTAACEVSESMIRELMEFAPECIAFFSPSAVNAYVATGLRDNPAIKKSVLIHAAIGPVTAEALQRVDCTPIAEAQRQNEASLLDAIASDFHKD
jgi:hydroxymethylbilane synthase